MTNLILGANGATGRLLVAELLKRGKKVTAVVRAPESLSDTFKHNPLLSIVHASINDLSDDEIRQLVSGCTGIASCLGHNLTLRGMYGAPRRLVTDATRRLCEAMRATQVQQPVRFVLMNTAGNRNRGLDEPVSFAQRCIVGLIRVLVPPHADNEQAAEYLRTNINPDGSVIEWSVVRPDSLVNEDVVSAYEIYPSPTRSAIFNAGKTSRINVAHFMAELISDDNTWRDWKGQMPVIYNIP